MTYYLLRYLALHLLCSTIGISTTLFTSSRLTVGNILMGLSFGPLYMIHEWMDLDAVVINLKREKE